MIACHVAAALIYLMQVAAGQSGGDTWQVQAGRRMILRLLEGAIIRWHLSVNDWRIVGSDASRRQMIGYD
ncbi:hypothetical protein Tco_1436613 [Tanacetum coccineum]